MILSRIDLLFGTPGSQDSGFESYHIYSFFRKNPSSKSVFIIKGGTLGLIIFRAFKTASVLNESVHFGIRIHDRKEREGRKKRMVEKEKKRERRAQDSRGTTKGELYRESSQLLTQHHKSNSREIEA